MNAAEPVFAASQVTVSYGSVRALRGVDLEVRPGQMVGLIGPNGSGKTTFIDAITGFVGSGGQVRLAGKDISSLAPDRRARLGLARTWQSIELFDDLSVERNVLVGLHHPSLRELLGEVFSGCPQRQEIAEALELVDLKWAARSMPDVLSLGQRKLVGVARALARRPKLLCLDEPAAGLDRPESERLGLRLRSLADAGQAMLLIDHDMGLVMKVCDYIVVIDFGEVIAAGPPAEVVRNPAVLEAYLGSQADRAATNIPASDEAQVQA